MARDLVVICDLPLTVGDTRQYYGAARDLAFIASVASPLESKFYGDAKKTLDAARELLAPENISVSTPIEQVIPAHKSLCELATDVWVRAASINVPQVREARDRLALLSSELQIAISRAAEAAAQERALASKPLKKNTWVFWLAGIGVVSGLVYAVKRRG